MLGHIAAKYESNSNWGAISSGKGDPGGKSYGAFQFSSNMGVLAKFVKFTRFKSSLQKYPIASRGFDNEWKRLSKLQRFQEDQLLFIKKSHYTPVRKFATELEIPSTRAINEAIFSISVQHGRAKAIVSRTAVNLLDNAREEDIINMLYQVRTNYVKGLKLSNRIKQAIFNRYINERRDVLRLINKQSGDTITQIKNKSPKSRSKIKIDKARSPAPLLIVIGLMIGGIIALVLGLR